MLERAPSGRSAGALLLALALVAVGAARPRAQGPEHPAFWRVLERAIDKGGVRAEADAALEHLRGVPERRAALAHRLGRVDRMLREPWTPPELGRELRELLAAPAMRAKGPRFEGLFEGLASWLDAELAGGAGLAELDERWSEIAAPELQGLALLEALSQYVGLAHALLAEALEALGDPARIQLFEGHAPFCEGWLQSHFPGASLPEEQSAQLARLREELLLPPPSARPAQLAVARALARLAEPSFLNGLARRLGGVRTEVPPGFDRDVLAVVGEEPARRVVLSGGGNAVHAQPSALLVELGGKDRHERAAVVSGPEQLVSVVLDLGGDDHYESAERGPCYAAGGVALLVDQRGDDRYVSKRLGQAASVLGVALLLDLAGSDRYELLDYGQGHALRGVALLYDLAGDDRYSAHAYAQGAGIAGGLSALIDGAGDDSYLADGGWPDVYGDSGPGVHHGASQGYCTGLRPSVAGGLAALLDLGNGRDRYQAGSFSQGGGYYFSFGLAFDGGGDDLHVGARYAQGFGVHQAIGMHWEAGGNDRYECKSVAHAGMAWDEGVGYFLEEGGDDQYATGDLSCGGAAQTGVAIFLELGGDDRFTTGGASQGGCGGFEYHDKPSLALHLDLGAGKDERSLEGRAEGALRTDAGVGVFLDSAARDAERALAARSLR